MLWTKFLERQFITNVLIENVQEEESFGRVFAAVRATYAAMRKFVQK